MPWDASPGAGFSAAAPWLPLNDDWEARNVAVQADDPASMLSLCRRLIALRRASPALTLGDYAPVSTEGGVLVFARTAAGERMLVALNFTHEPQTAVLPAGDWLPVCSTASPTPARRNESGRLSLAADEGVILRRTA
jgi:glycosidase